MLTQCSNKWATGIQTTKEHITIFRNQIIVAVQNTTHALQETGNVSMLCIPRDMSQERHFALDLIVLDNYTFNISLSHPQTFNL